MKPLTFAQYEKLTAAANGPFSFTLAQQPTQWWRPGEHFTFDWQNSQTLNSERFIVEMGFGRMVEDSPEDDTEYARRLRG